ncbi:MAG: ATP-binding cassette domain-containing protein [Fidelibacterota bacterium]|nr:MAG: ATP-binding cassette domain-containing protein [Candidatus Neomarinimicrobiota bacterium]
MIRVENLTKYYGDVCAIKDVNFTVHDGEILGFLGPNGAGKTTTLRIITTYLTPTAGTVYIDDLNIAEHSNELRSRIGYLPELNPMYAEMPVIDLLVFVASARGITGRRFKEALGRVMESCGIREVLHRLVGELSKGYRQRVGLAMAMIHDPEILIMDEPSAGLDPNQIVEIRALIKELGKEKTVIMSSHILQEVQAVADRMVILNKGQVVADGTTTDLMAGFEGKAQLTLEVKKATKKSIQGLATKFTDIQIQVDNIKNGAGILELEYPTGQDLREQIFGYAVESGWVVLEMSRRQARLEDIFRSLTVEEGGAHA